MIEESPNPRLAMNILPIALSFPLAALPLSAATSATSGATSLASIGAQTEVQEKEKPAQKPKTQPVRWVKEPDTGVRFPDRIQSKHTQKTMALAGVAVRDKRFVILVNVYAYALYVQEDAIGKHLSAYNGKSAKALQGNQRFFGALGKAAIPRTMRLQFVRGVGAKKIRNAFVDSVEPRIEYAAKQFGWTDGAKALQTFRAYFGNKVKNGEVIEFTWLPGHKLKTTIAGKSQGTITSKALCWALWDTYFGPDPIEKKGKKTAVQQLTERLERTPKVKTPAPKKKDSEQGPKEKGKDEKQKEGAGTGG